MLSGHFRELTSRIRIEELVEKIVNVVFDNKLDLRLRIVVSDLLFRQF